MLTIMAVMIHFHEIMSVMCMLGIAVPELGESRDPEKITDFSCFAMSQISRNGEAADLIPY